MLKIGVLGAGHLGKIHLKILKESKIFELIGVYDLNPITTKNSAESLGIIAFETPEKLIQAVDVVDIVTPTITHFELAKQAILAQKHVFIEKPITATLEQANTLYELSKQHPVQIQVGHIERYNPALIASIPYLKNPKFIEIHRLAPFNPRGTDVSVVLDLMIHDIDTLLYITQSEIKDIYANGVCVLSNTPDICNVRLEFTNGAVANLTASRISMHPMRKARFFQKDKYIAVDFLQKKCEMIQLKKNTTNTTPLDTTDPYCEIVFAHNNTQGVQIQQPIIQHHNAIAQELESFGNAIHHKQKPEVDIIAGKNALKVALDIIDQIEKKQIPHLD